MLKPSRERIAQIARLIVDDMDRSEHVKLLKDREAIRQSVIHALVDELRQDDDRQTHVLARLAAMDGTPPRGSREYDALFRKMLDEEYERTGFDSA